MSMEILKTENFLQIEHGKFEGWKKISKFKNVRKSY